MISTTSALWLFHETGAPLKYDMIIYDTDMEGEGGDHSSHPYVVALALIDEQVSKTGIRISMYDCSGFLWINLGIIRDLLGKEIKEKP